MRIIHLVLSDDTFGGFEHYVHLTNNIVSIQNLIDCILNKLRETLHFHKLENGKVILQKKKFHIHGLTLNEIKNRIQNETVYVCSH